MTAPSATASRSCGTDMNVNCGSSSGCVTIKRFMPRFRASSRIMQRLFRRDVPRGERELVLGNQVEHLEHLGQQLAVARHATEGRCSLL